MIRKREDNLSTPQHSTTHEHIRDRQPNNHDAFPPCSSIGSYTCTPCNTSSHSYPQCRIPSQGHSLPLSLELGTKDPILCHRYSQRLRFLCIANVLCNYMVSTSCSIDFHLALKMVRHECTCSRLLHSTK